MLKLPLIAPRPPRLSEMGDALRALEASGYYSNGGPIVRQFEREAAAKLFGGEGFCLAVSNATLGLMLAIREARAGRSGRYALVPAFTFAATAHAAIWAGLTPILVDSDPADWAMSAAAEEALLEQYGDEIAVVVPYDTFGVGIDLARYQALSERYGVGVVIDAAASLGSLDAQGRGFGTGARFACVFSMHATKTFATAEGGLVYSTDEDRIWALRRMQNFGFGAPRTATQQGINAKLPEILGLLALTKLQDIDAVADHRAALEQAYRDRLGDAFTFQARHATRQVAQFMPLLLPAGTDRAAVMADLTAAGIGSGHYFSPHIGEQPYFQQACLTGQTPVADDLSARMLSLPVTDAMSVADVHTVCDALVAATAKSHVTVPAAFAPQRFSTVLVGGGPSGIALLVSASKNGKLRDFAAGLALVERSDSLGTGELPGYGITSDSTAETFLSAAKDNPEPAIAALIDHPGARDIAGYIGQLGVPLNRTGPFLAAMGDRIGAIVRESGGQVLTGHEVTEARQTAAGLWQVTVRGRDGERTLIADNIVIATGGYQSPTGVAAAKVAGASLGERLGDRLMLCDDLLRTGGMERLRARLGDHRAPRVAIVGASTSAIASAVLLLKSGIPFGAQALSLVHREALRPWYPNVEAAIADGFTDFGPDDICPLSGFVYRLAGFRLEARELVLRMLEIGGRTPDPRMRFHHLAEGTDPVAAAILDEADLVVAALGYRPHALPLFDVGGERIALTAHAPGRPRLADQHCRVIDAAGRPIPGAYGIGLAAGFVPEGRLGGEKSFKGKANGLWQWQNDVGQLIIDQLMGESVSLAA